MFQLWSAASLNFGRSQNGVLGNESIAFVSIYRRIFQFRKKISQRSFTQKIIDPHHPVYIDKVDNSVDCLNGVLLCVCQAPYLSQ